MRFVVGDFGYFGYYENEFSIFFYIVLMKVMIDVLC